MLILARSVGFYFLITGFSFLVNPASLKHYIAFWSTGRRLYGVGIGRLLSAGILLAAAPGCRYPWVIGAIGVFNLALGIPCFLRGAHGMRSMVALWSARPVRAVRMLGAVSVALGAAIIVCV